MFNGESGKDTISKAGVTDFKLFLEWHLENSKVGALSTLETRWKYLRLYYTCEVGHAIDKNMSTEITAFLSQLAFKADLQQDKKPKGVITHHDVGHLLRSHWEYQWDGRQWRLKDGRRRIELALIVLLLSYTAGRPRAVLDTMCHLGEALKYKNFEIVAIRNGGERLYTMKVSYHLVKGNWGKGKNPTEFHCFEDKESLIYCPLQLFLALALADNAFEMVKTQNDIENLSIPVSQEGLTLKFREEILEQNVFRNKKGNPLSYDKFLLAFKEMAWKAGFPGRVSPYHIRRGAGIAIDSMATIAQRMHAMNHTVPDVFKSYQPSSTLVDTQGAFMRQDPRQGLKDKLLSSGLLRDPNAPALLSEANKREMEALPVFSAAKKSVTDMAIKLKDKVRQELHADGFS